MRNIMDQLLALLGISLSRPLKQPARYPHLRPSVAALGTDLDKISLIVCNICHDRNNRHERKCATCGPAVRFGMGKSGRALGCQSFGEPDPCAPVCVQATACGGRRRGCSWDRALQCVEFPAGIANMESHPAGS